MNWWYLKQKQVYGPFTEQQMKQLYWDGTVTLLTKTCQDGANGWKSFSQSSLAQELISTPLTQKDNIFAWLFVVELCLNACNILFLHIIVPLTTMPSAILYAAVLFAIDALIGSWDIKRLGQKGRLFPKKYLWFCILPVVYLFVRASAIRKYYSIAVIALIIYLIPMVYQVIFVF